MPSPAKLLLLLSIAVSCVVASNHRWRTINGLKEISPKYDTFIIDQWGVIHDGKTPYPGAFDCLEYLKAEKKKLIMLSNSSKRKSSSIKGLEKVGINANIWDEIVTSGELGWNMIKTRNILTRNIESKEDGRLLRGT